MRHPELPFALSIAVVLLLVPLPSHIRRRSIAILTLIISTLLLVFTTLVNTIVWAGNFRDVAPVWCDISTAIQFCWPYAAGGAVLSICIHLEWITSLRSEVSTRPHRTLVEMVLCFVPPLVCISFRYILATSRYAILEDLGCSLVIEGSTLWLATTFIPALLMATTAAVFAGLAVRNLIRFQKFTQFRNSRSTITKFHFVRMLATCIFIGVWPLFVPLLMFFGFNPSGKLTAWRGWASSHRNFQDIPHVPSTFQSLNSSRVNPFLVMMWLEIMSAYVIFGILVCTEDVRGDLGVVRNYVVEKIFRHRSVGQQLVSLNTSENV